MEILTALFALIAFAMIDEYLVNVVKGWLPDSVLVYIKPLHIAALLGQLLAFTFQLDFFAAFGFISANAYISYFLTGIIISAGAVPLHELISKIRASRNDIDKLN